jgi:hypothetical protein
MAGSPTPPRIGTPATPRLGVAETMPLLRATVPALEAMTRGATAHQLTGRTAYGWSVTEQLAHLRGVAEVLAGHMLRIAGEEHPSWRARGPRGRPGETDYFEWAFAPAFEVFSAQRAELLAAIEPLPAAAWERTATVIAPPNVVYEYSLLYYGDWIARHERSHLKHMAKIIRELASTS